MTGEFEESLLEQILSQEEIQQKLTLVAKKIDQEYAGKEIVIVFILKGAICLVADLIRSIKIPSTIEFLQAKSYGEKGVSRGALTILGIEQIAITDKDVLLVDDIFDSGETLLQVTERLKKQHPRSIKTLVLLCKKVPRTTNYQPDYILFEIENRFVVGYGLDYKEKYRGLPGIYAMTRGAP